MPESDIVRILKQIEQEYQASKRGLEGFASGTARHDLLALENILSGNIGYLRNTVPLSAQTVTKIHLLEEIRARIQRLRLGGDGERAPVSRDDILVLREAMLTFVQLTRRLVPASPERDETLRRVSLLRRHLETMLLPEKKGKNHASTNLV